MDVLLEMLCLKELLIRKSRIPAVAISGRAGRLTPASWSDASVTQLIRFSRELVLRRGPAHQVSVHFGSANPGRREGHPLHPAQDAAHPAGPAHPLPALLADDDDPPQLAAGGDQDPDPPNDDPPDDVDDPDPPNDMEDDPPGELDPPGDDLAEPDAALPMASAAVGEDAASGSGVDVLVEGDPSWQSVSGDASGDAGSASQSGDASVQQEHDAAASPMTLEVQAHVDLVGSRDADDEEDLLTGPGMAPQDVEAVSPAEIDSD